MRVVRVWVVFVAVVVVGAACGPPPSYPDYGIAGPVDHVCAVTPAGELTCWGSNYYGQLGNVTNSGTAVPNTAPAVVAGVAGVLAVAVGGNTCALVSDGTVTCFGKNFNGESGNATGTVYHGAHPTPTPVSGVATVTAITAGSAHTCALKADATVSCWGSNGKGQLGNSTNLGQNSAANPLPATVAGLTNVVQVAAGGQHTCAVLGDGTVSCWGLNEDGQLGNAVGNGTLNPNPTPTAVAGLTDVARVELGNHHTCAVKTDGSVWCWGDNWYGQLGNATNLGVNLANPTPAEVVGVDDVVSIASGWRHTCAASSDGSVRCWGWNRYGQLGNATGNNTNDPVITPTVVAGLADVVEVTSQADIVIGHTCARRTDDSVACWGLNEVGQLGTSTNAGTQTPNPSPIDVVGVAGVALPG